MCCYFGCLKSWGLCEHDFDWLENTMPHGGWRRLSISFLFKSQSLPVTLFLIPVPRLQLRSHAHLQYTSVSLSCWLGLAHAPSLLPVCTCLWGPIYSVYLNAEVLITNSQDPQHLLVKSKFIASFLLSSINPQQDKTEMKLLLTVFLHLFFSSLSSHHKSWHF